MNALRNTVANVRIVVENLREFSGCALRFLWAMLHSFLDMAQTATRSLLESPTCGQIVEEIDSAAIRRTEMLP
jgi:hypothetical protein